jgi:hypothetical protein
MVCPTDRLHRLKGPGADDGGVRALQVEDRQDGTYRCTYMTSKAGAYLITVTLNGAERCSRAFCRPWMTQGLWALQRREGGGGWVGVVQGLSFSNYQR